MNKKVVYVGLDVDDMLICAEFCSNFRMYLNVGVTILLAEERFGAQGLDLILGGLLFIANGGSIFRANQQMSPPAKKNR